MHREIWDEIIIYSQISTLKFDTGWVISPHDL